MNSYSLDYIDDLYVQYIRDPASVSPGWRKYFEEFSLAAGAEQASTEQQSSRDQPNDAMAEGDPGGNGQGSVAVASSSPTEHALSIRDEAIWLARMQDRVDNLVREYRVRGHLMARLDPLKRERRHTAELDPELYGLNEDDLSRPFSCKSLEYVNGRTLGDIVDKLRSTYCRSIGAQFMHIDNRTIRDR